MMANDWGDLGFVPDNDDFADLGFQPDSLARAAAEFDIDEPQKLAPLSTFWNALTQIAAEKPALMLRGVTAYTPDEATGFDKTLGRVADRLSTLKDPEKRKRAELALQGHLWPARSDDPWYASMGPRRERRGNGACAKRLLCRQLRQQNRAVDLNAVSTKRNPPWKPVLSSLFSTTSSVASLSRITWPLAGPVRPRSPSHYHNPLRRAIGKPHAFQTLTDF